MTTAMVLEANTRLMAMKMPAALSVSRLDPISRDRRFCQWTERRPSLGPFPLLDVILENYIVLYLPHWHD